MSQLLPQEQKKAGFCRLLFVVIPFFITPFYPCINEIISFQAATSQDCFFLCKGIATENIQVPLRYLNTIFQ